MALSSVRNPDLTKILKEEHAGKWVALSPNRTKVIAYSEDLSELEKKVGNKDVIYKKVLRIDTSYVF